MEKLSDLIKARLDRHNLDTSAKSAEVLYFANQILVDSLDSPDQPVKAYKFDKGILFISTKNASFGQELWGVQESVLKSLKKRFGENVVKKIRIKSLTID